MSSGAYRYSGMIACVTALGLGLTAHPVAAATKPQPAKRAAPPRPAPPAPEDDGLGPRDIYLEADELVDDRDAHTVSARGNAEARYGGRVIRAQSITYNSETGQSHASGDVTIINPDKTLQFAQEVDLDQDLNTGVALAFAARLENNVTITAGAAVRRNENVLELNQARFTPCVTCRENGTSKEPTFSIQASRILQDHDRQVIYYRNAVIRVMGVPVFYAPIFWHPDPTAERRSGFLTPRISVSNKRGLSYEQPYLWVINPSTDLTISPQINTTVNPLLNLHFRERFYSGQLDIRAGYTYEQNFDNNNKFGEQTSRSYILAKGEFEIDKHWSWGFGAERVSDPSLFRRYNIREIYSDRGAYSADTDRLISQIFTERQDTKSYLSVAAVSFQSLRPNGAAPLVINGKTYYETQFESAKTFPTVAPMIEAKLASWLFGGRLDVGASAVALSRDNPVVAVIDPAGVHPSGPTKPGTALQSATSLQGLKYTDSRRASVYANWRRSFVTPIGVRVDPFVQVNGDAYSIGNGRLITVAPTGVFTDNGAAKGDSNRGYVTAGADISYPLIKPLANGGSIILEPLAQFAVSPRSKLNANIPNEDSTATEFDESNLFAINRFAGHDLYEGGARLNLAGRARVELGNSRSATVMVGRSFRDEVDPLFTVLSGLRTVSSDWITYAEVRPLANLTVFNRARFDQGDMTIKREEAGINLSFARFYGAIRYNYNTNGLSYTTTGSGASLVYNTLVGKTEDVSANANLFLTKNWGISVNATRDLQNNVFPVAQIGLIYLDDCIRLDLIYTHDETFRGFGAKVGASDSLGFRLTLATLGDTPAYGGRRNDSR